MKKRSAQHSAFFNGRLLVSLALASIGFLLALLTFALYPGGNALAQIQVSPHLAQEEETQESPQILGTTEISLPQEPDSTLQPNETIDTPLVGSCIVTALPNNGGLSGNERGPHTGYRWGRSVYLITAAELAA